MTEIVVKLPWPPQQLKPNWRGHWAAKARAVKRYRSDAAYLTRCTTPLTFNGYAGKVDIQCEFCTPDRLGINDRKFHHLEHQYRFSGRQRYGYVLVHVFIKEV